MRRVFNVRINPLVAGAVVLAAIAVPIWARSERPATVLSPGPLTFSLTETTGISGERLARVSFPLAKGEVRTLKGAEVQTSSGKRIAAQLRILNRHRDGSVRRVLVRFPWRAQAGSTEQFTLIPVTRTDGKPGRVQQPDPFNVVMSAGQRLLRTEGKTVLILRGGQKKCTISFAGPDFPVRFLGPEIQVVEDGPYFSWVNLTYFGGMWNVHLELQADHQGEVRVIGRLLMTRDGEAAAPRFGLSVSGLAGDFRTHQAEKLPFSTTIANGGPRQFSFGSETAFELPDGAQIRQGRLEVKAEGGGSSLHFVRDASLDQTVADEDKLFYEGQERSVELLLLTPGKGQRLALRTEIPAQRRSVAVMEVPLVRWGRLEALRQVSTENALKLVCRDGDQYGDVAGAVNQQNPKWAIGGGTRIDTGLDMLEDYYRGGDYRLRDLALGWAENWVSLKQYRGWDMNSYGGERYTDAAWRYIPTFNQKGIMMIAHAFEETGDPRYEESVRAFGNRIVSQLKNRYFVTNSGYYLEKIPPLANIRAGFLGRDLVYLYRWTGEEEYLSAARVIFRGLAQLRTADYGVLRESYLDPFSPFDRLMTGTDLGVSIDNEDHPKPFILAYLLDGSQELCEETQDPIGCATMTSLSNFILEAMHDGAIWNYAHRHAAEGNSPGHMTAEFGNSLMKSYVLTKDERYKQAAFQAFHLVSLTLKEYGTFLSFAGNPEDRQYFYPEDHCDLDFYRSRWSAENLERDTTAYFFSGIDRILRSDPQAADFLLSPPTHPRHKWLVEQAPIEGQPKTASRLAHPSVTLYGQGIRAEKEGRFREAIATWESILQRWPDSSPELYRQIGLWQKLGETGKLLETCQRFISAFPNHARVPSVKMRMAEEAIRDHRLGDATEMLNRIQREHPGAWAEEASVRLWQELGLGQPPGTLIPVSVGSSPSLSSVNVLEQYDGSISKIRLRAGAYFDERNLYLNLEMPWHSDVEPEEMILFLDPRGEMTDYLTFSVDSSGNLKERGSSWHQRRQPLEKGSGWTAEMTHSKDSWGARIVIPFEKIGFRPTPGHRSWRFGFRWKTPRGDRFWRPSLPEVTRPQDCGWLVFAEAPLGAK